MNSFLGWVSRPSAARLPRLSRRTRLLEPPARVAPTEHMRRGSYAVVCGEGHVPAERSPRRNASLRARRVANASSRASAASSGTGSSRALERGYRASALSDVTLGQYAPHHTHRRVARADKPKGKTTTTPTWYAICKPESAVNGHHHPQPPPAELNDLPRASTGLIESAVDLLRADAQLTLVQARHLGVHAITALLTTLVGCSLLQVTLVVALLSPLLSHWLSAAQLVAAIAIPAVLTVATLGAALGIWGRARQRVADDTMQRGHEQ